MIKGNVTIVKDSAGKLSVLCLTEDADEAISALKGFDGDGEVGFYRLTTPHKFKKSGAALMRAVTMTAEAPADDTQPEPADDPEGDPQPAKKRGRPRKA